MPNNIKDETKQTLDPVIQLRKAYEKRWKLLTERSEKMGLSLPNKEQLWKKVLNQWNRGFKCEYCNDKMKIKEQLPAPKTFTLEHSIALHNGGNNAVENIHIVCKDCNTQKNVLTPELFNQILTGNKKRIPGLSPMLCEFFKITENGWGSEYLPVTVLLKHLSRRSKSASTRRNYLIHLRAFCLWCMMKPDELTTLSPKKASDLVQRFTDTYNTPSYSRRTTNNVLITLKTFYEANGYKGQNALEVERYYTPSRYRKRKEVIPSKHEIYMMADNAGSLRNRAIILSLFSCGVRNSTLRALLYNDVKDELLAGRSIIKIPIYPEMKKNLYEGCKGNIKYYSFISEEASDAVRRYLRQRVEKYGAVRDNDPLFASEHNQVHRNLRSSQFLTSRQLQKIVKQAAKDANIKKWKQIVPNSLRKSFESVLRNKTYDDGRLDIKVQEFLMGHILPGSQDHYFDATKIEEIRMNYAALKFGRVVVENKFKRLRRAVAEAFEGTDINVDMVIDEYVQRKSEIQQSLGAGK